MRANEKTVLLNVDYICTYISFPCLSLTTRPYNASLLEFLRTLSTVVTELMYVYFGWLYNNGVSMYKSLNLNFVYELLSTSPVVLNKCAHIFTLTVCVCVCVCV